jgi:AcrR family transcriptional regulator
VPLPFRSEVATPPRRRTTFLSQGEIVSAAATILERDGYDALNMRSIAAELGVRAAALYRYVSGRDELDDLLFDHLMAGCATEVAGRDWREDLRTIANVWRSRLIERRDATRIALGLVSIGPNVAPLMEACLGALRRTGLEDDEVVRAYDAFMLFVHSFASSEASFRSLESRSSLRHTPVRPEWASVYPTVMALVDKLAVAPDFDAQFDFGLDALIAGIERRATPS